MIEKFYSPIPRRAKASACRASFRALDRKGRITTKRFHRPLLVLFWRANDRWMRWEDVGATIDGREARHAFGSCRSQNAS